MANICFAQQKQSNSKIKGICFIAPKQAPLKATTFEKLKTSHANWLAIVPEATLERTSLLLRPDRFNNNWGETIEASIQSIQLAKKAGYKIMLKPHIVLSELPIKKQKNYTLLTTQKAGKPLKDKTRGVEWRGDFVAKNEKDWQLWENAYEDYVLKLARIADSMDVELFCIGTELRKSAIKRPQYWQQLIQKIRAIYKGKLTYAANWDAYHKISFWAALDFIGIDSYFPVSRAKTPSIKKAIKTWRPIQRKLKKFSKQHQKQLLITEFGYRNVVFAGKRPWTHDKDNAAINYEAQTNLYHAFFKTFWKKSWIAGGFSWNWFAVPKQKGNTSFSIQNKPAFSVLQQWYLEEE